MPINPWGLYSSNGGYDSIDTRLTDEQTQEFIRQNQDALHKSGVSEVFVGRFGFFYVRVGDLEKNGFIEGGALNLTSLIPYLMGFPIFIMINPFFSRVSSTS